ncbi:flagellar export chaperone FliS [Aquicella lusitana]|uniref:Flagellar secretion chaperone FliS n=1 Tax=Aquicella lusitana TaxID=254246 RepID=A0A370G832_9COXI|nr:flagellar export chaperone FliS [Aquicella lusitana]RDI39952.1 flagellar protein FliS [Aquicella lusitana]VVC74555.1 Flagellar protein FliS [Aquicella lusitana]
MNTSPAIYSEIEITTEVMSASRHRLIQMLFEKCLQQIQLAKAFVSSNEMDNRNNCIKKANEIILYLRACLNFQEKSAVDLANLLDSNYVFIEKCLLNAMLKNDEAYLDIALIVINNIKSGWDEIGKEYNQEK